MATVYTERVCTIANGATVGSAVNIGGGSVVGVILPAAFTGTALTFQVSNDNITYRVLNNTTVAISLTVAPSIQVGLTQDIQDAFAGVGWVKCVSGTAEGAQRLVTLLVRRKR
jgi:hypothetical protein